MKKFVVFIISLAVMLSSMSLAVFAAESESAFVSVGINISSLDVYPSPNSQNYTNYGSGETVSVRAGSRFDINFSVTVPDEYANGKGYATVSGQGFSVMGAVAGKEISASASTFIPVYVDSSVTTGRYPVTLSVTYTAPDGTTGTAAQLLNINVIGNGTDSSTPPAEIEGSASLEITSAPRGSVGAGEVFSVGFSSYCTAAGSYGLYNVRGVVTVSGEGFSLAGALAEQNITSGGNSISVLADESLEAGRHQLVVTVTYKSGSETYTASRTLNIDIESSVETVDESNDKASFKLTGGTIPEKKGKSNLSTTLKLSFENRTGYTAENVKIRLSNLGDLILNTFTDTVEAGDVAGGESINASFPIKFPEFPKAQTTVVAEVTFDTPAGPQTESFNVYLQATEKKEDTTAPETGSLTPKVIVSRYDVDVETVTSGAEFVFTFVLKNTSTEKDLKNMTVNVTPQGFTSSSGGTSASSGPVFSFVDGTSSFYTDLLEKDGELEYSIRLKCSASAGAGSYPINISFNFEYANNGGYSSSSGDMDINLPVSQPIKFDLLEWTPPTECPLSGVPISFQYYNRSRNPMTSLVISVEGDFEMPVQTIGTLAASSYDYFSGTLTPVEGAKVGETKTAVIVFTFEDAAGEEQRVEEAFDMTVTEASDDMPMGGIVGPDMMGGGDFTVDYLDPSGMGGMEFDENGMPITGDNVEEKSGLPLWAKIAIPSAIGVVAIAVIVVVVKKVKAKKNAEDDEDEE